MPISAAQPTPRAGTPKDIGPPAPLDAKSIALYTAGNEGLISVTSGISDLAHELGDRFSGRLDKIASFWNYIIDHLMIGAVHHHKIDMQQPMDWLLKNIWADCQLGSAFLVSLCRAVGIPSRLVGGYLLYPLAPSQHFWTEIWIEKSGWVPFDLLSWDLSKGGRDKNWRDCFAGES